MVATTAVGTHSPGTARRVSTSPARHGRHAARAAKQLWRALAPEQVRELRTRADADVRAYRARLPKWHTTSAHRELTSGLYRHKGRSYKWRHDPVTGRREYVPEGTTSRVTWLDRASYLNVIVPLRLAEADAGDVLKANHVDPDTFRRWVRHESLFADPRTGRRIIRRAKTIAALMEVSERTVQRCRSAGRELGLYATIYPGRMLDQGEQVKARYRGSAQRGLAAESAFVVPRSLVRNGTVSCLHRGAAHGQIFDSPNAQQSLNTQGEKGATPSPLSKKRRRRASPAYKLALAVVDRLPWARGADPRRFAGLLHRFATAAYPWTADDVVRHVDHVNTRRGWSAVHSPAELRAPAYALLAKTYLRDVDPVADHPRGDVFLEQERAAARRADQLAARALHDAGERCGRAWCC